MKYKILYSEPYEGWNFLCLDNDFDSIEEAKKIAIELSLKSDRMSYMIISVHSKEIYQGKEI